MSSPGVVYVDYNFDDTKYPNRPGQGTAFFTHGFGSIYARKFKEYNPDWRVQCWKADRFTTKQEQAEISSVQYRIFPARKFSRAGYFSFRLIKNLRKHIKENPQDIINISSFDHLLFWSIALLLPKSQIVLQHHGECPAKHRMKHSKGFRKLIWFCWSRVEEVALKKCGLFYALDPDIAQWIPVNPTKIKVQGTGVDISLFPEMKKSEARQKLGLSDSAQYLVYMGRLTNSKRPDMLIECYPALKIKFPELQLLLGGCQPSDPFYEAAVKAGAVTHGIIPQQEMHLWLSAADVYSLPLLDTAHVFGGIGMLPVQAMLCGTPVVGSTMKCLPDEDRTKAGIHTRTRAELEDAIINILNRKISYTETRTVAMKYYDWKSISQHTRHDYMALMQH